MAEAFGTLISSFFGAVWGILSFLFGSVLLALLVVLAFFFLRYRFHPLRLNAEALRSCLVSIQKQTNKSERKHLKRVLQFALAVFPKSATFIDPSKRALDNPAFWQNSKGVEFTAFNDLNICARKSVDGVGKIFSGVTSIHQNLLEHRQMIRYIIIIVNHVDCSVPVGHIGSCYHDHVGQP